MRLYKRGQNETIQEKQHNNLQKLVHESNAEKKKLKAEWFVCAQCDRLCFDETCYEECVSKWGDKALFCYCCVFYCDTCEENYVEPMAYYHDNCPGRGCGCAWCMQSGRPAPVWYATGYDDDTDTLDGRPEDHPYNNSAYETYSHSGHYIVNVPGGCEKVNYDINVALNPEQIEQNHKIVEYFAPLL